MTLDLLAFLTGLFVVPLVLLTVGHKLRRRRPRTQRMFWGGVVGYCIAAMIAVVWGMMPPESWEAGETARGLAGLWGMVLLPAVGAAWAALTAGGAD